MSELLFRGYRPTDAKAMYALDVVCFDKRFRFSLRAMRRFAETRNAITIVADFDGGLAGFVIAHPEQDGVYLVTLDVALEWRRKGIARQLVERVEKEAAVTHAARFVLLHVFVGNAPAISFYEGRGYTRLGHVPGFYGAGLDAFVYRQAL